MAATAPARARVPISKRVTLEMFEDDLVDVADPRSDLGIGGMADI